jgi:hypothetical protein
MRARRDGVAGQGGHTRGSLRGFIGEFRGSLVRHVFPVLVRILCVASPSLPWPSIVLGAPQVMWVRMGMKMETRAGVSAFSRCKSSRWGSLSRPAGGLNPVMRGPGGGRQRWEKGDASAPLLLEY